MTSGNAAGTKFAAEPPSLPTPPTRMTPAASAAQIAPWSGSSAHEPQVRLVPQLMFATSTSLAGSMSVFSATTWSTPQSTSASDEPPASVNDLIGTSCALGRDANDADAVERRGRDPGDVRAVTDCHRQGAGHRRRS